MSFGLSYVKDYDLSSLKKLGSVGEPINEEAWHWFKQNIGKGLCPLVDTWWQTETGGIMISSLAGVTPERPTYATLPLPGIQPVLVDEKGEIIEGNDVSGNLCIKFPWPGIIRTTYGDHERCKQTYFSTYPGMYFTGDGCLRDEDGNYRITGRVDDVMNVSGHRIGTAEVENAINMHLGVVESAVVGYPHEIKGQGIYAYIITENKPDDPEMMRKDIAATVSRLIGPIAKPDKIQFVAGLPKTRSGKIMRRILRKVAEGEMGSLGDTSTLLDPGVVEEIKAGSALRLIKEQMAGNLNDFRPFLFKRVSCLNCIRNLFRNRYWCQRISRFSGRYNRPHPGKELIRLFAVSYQANNLQRPIVPGCQLKRMLIMMFTMPGITCDDGIQAVHALVGRVDISTCQIGFIQGVK
jgi:hypothetical protein